MAKKKSQKSKKWCQAYKSSNQRMKNKKIKLEKHVARNHGNDKSALAALNKIKIIVP